MDNYSLLLGGFFGVILCIVAAVYYWRNQQLTADLVKLPYTPQQNFLTPAELNFYRVISHSTADLDCSIMCKVRVADLLKVEKSLLEKGESWRKYFNKIQAKHIDFIVCDDQMRPKLFIELDDSSHQKKQRQERDVFLNQAFKDAGLKLVRVKVQQSYDRKKFRAGVLKALG